MLRDSITSVAHRFAFRSHGWPQRRRLYVKYANDAYLKTDSDSQPDQIVKAALFADAKPGKNPVEHILGIHRANHLAELIDRCSDFYRNQLGMESGVVYFQGLREPAYNRLQVFTAAGCGAGDRKASRDRPFGKLCPESAAKFLNANSGMGTALNIDMG